MYKEDAAAKADGVPKSSRSTVTLLLYNAQDFDSESFPSVERYELQRNRKVAIQLMERMTGGTRLFTLKSQQRISHGSSHALIVVYLEINTSLPHRCTQPPTPRASPLARILISPPTGRGKQTGKSCGGTGPAALMAAAQAQGPLPPRDAAPAGISGPGSCGLRGGRARPG